MPLAGTSCEQDLVFCSYTRHCRDDTADIVRVHVEIQSSLHHPWTSVIPPHSFRLIVARLPVLEEKMSEHTFTGNTFEKAQ
jgi:hypothetical protein